MHTKPTLVFTLALLSLLVSACASVPKLEEVELIKPDTQLIGVELIVNKDTPVATHYLSRLRAAQKYIVDSDVFETIESKSDSNIKVMLELNRKNLSGESSSRTALSAATLYLVPVKIVNETSLDIKIVYFDEVIKEYKYTQETRH